VRPKLIAVSDVTLFLGVIDGHPALLRYALRCARAGGDIPSRDRAHVAGIWPILFDVTPGAKKPAEPPTSDDPTVRQREEEDADQLRLHYIFVADSGDNQRLGYTDRRTLALVADILRFARRPTRQAAFIYPTALRRTSRTIQTTGARGFLTYVQRRHPYAPSANPPLLIPDGAQARILPASRRTFRSHSPKRCLCSRRAHIRNRRNLSSKARAISPDAVDAEHAPRPS
jgi:hypothetical protein